MEHVCTVPQAAGLMLSHLAALKHSRSFLYRGYLPPTFRPKTMAGCVYYVSRFESVSQIWLGISLSSFVT